MKCVLIYSGGMDSTALLYKLVSDYGVKNVYTISFDYKSKHNDQEYKMAKLNCEKLGVSNIRIPIHFINDYFKSDLLSSGGKIPEGHYAESNMKKTVVPFRNGIMLSIAIGYAESIEANKVFIGNHAGDHAVYPDCRATFISAINEASAYGTYNNVNIVSPFGNITKTDIAKIGYNSNVDWSLTYSCYNGEDVQCGRCSTCFERREAFSDSNIFDPTEYKDKTPFEELRKEYVGRLNKEK